MKKSTALQIRKLSQVRKIFLALSFMLVIAGASAYAASEPEISEKVKASFNKEFVGAHLLEWNDLGEYKKATFILGNHRTQAFFREDGQLAGSIRSLFYSQLPLAVMTSVDKRFAISAIWDVSEINNSSGTTYIITLETKIRKYKVKVDSNGNFNDIERIRKK